MEEEINSVKINEIVSVLIGLKRYEWSKVAKAVEDTFNSASSKLELNDAEKLTRLLQLDFHGRITQ